MSKSNLSDNASKIASIDVTAKSHDVLVREYSGQSRIILLNFLRVPPYVFKQNHRGPLGNARGSCEIGLCRCFESVEMISYKIFKFKITTTVYRLKAECSRLQNGMF